MFFFFISFYLFFQQVREREKDKPSFLIFETGIEIYIFLVYGLVIQTLHLIIKLYMKLLLDYIYIYIYIYDIDQCQIPLR